MNKLIPPFDSLEILRKYKTIKRELINQDGLIDLKIFIASGSTTDEIKNTLEVFLLNIGIRPIFLQGDYGLFYEDLAFKLSTDKEQLNGIKVKLKENLSSKPLFNTNLYTEDFENGLEEVFNNHIAGNAPKNIYVKSKI